MYDLAVSSTSDIDKYVAELMIRRDFHHILLLRCSFLNCTISREQSMF